MENRLSLYNPAPFYEWVDIAIDIPFPINYSIADVRDISKKNASASKTITIQGTKEVNRLFELVFELNISLQVFNPNLKTPAEYFIGFERVFKGNLQLLNVIKDYNGSTQDVRYECAIVGEAGDLYTAIGESYLTDLDFSALNHTLIYSRLSQAVTYGESIIYPFIDYGITGGITDTWNILHMKPAIPARAYLLKIFQAAGKTWTSTHLDSAYFRRLYIPCVNEGNLKTSSAIITAAQFYAGKTVNTTSTLNSTFATLGNYYYTPVPYPNSTYYFQQGVFNNDSTGGFFDPGAVYNNGTNVFTTNYTGYYNVTARLDFDILINPPAGTVYYTLVKGFYGFRVDLTYNGAYYATGYATVVPNISTPTTFSIQVTMPNQYLPSGTTVDVRIRASDQDGMLTNFQDGAFANIDGSTSSLTIRHLSTSTFQATLASQDINYSDTVVMNDTIPRLVKQRDFFSSIMKMENLYMELDKNNSNNYIIEPRESFIDYTSVLNWTDKLDTGKPIEVRPMGDLDFKNLTFTYKSDKDVLNESYNTTYKEVYATKTLVVDNDFIKSDKKTEVIFSATPIADNNFNDLIVPKLYKNDNGVIKPMACNIRILYVDRQVACSNFILTGSGTSVVTSAYNYAGMVDLPFAPTISLDWDNPLKLFYQYPAQTYTDNNLYGRGYSKLMEELTNKNSKIVKLWVNLNASDIRKFSFRKIIFIDGSYYFCNNIPAFIPNEKQSTQVELLKLKRGATFVPGVVNYGNGDPNNQNYEMNIAPNPNQGGGYGQDNVINGNGVMVIGNNNFVG